MQNEIKIYSMFDNKVNCHGKPMFYQSKQHCIAELSSFINDNKANGDINPIDFELFYIGEYSQQTGKFITPEKPLHLFNMRTLVKQNTKMDKTIKSLTKKA